MLHSSLRDYLTTLLAREVAVGILLLAVPLAFALIPSVLTLGSDPYAFSTQVLQPPDSSHLMGTDSLGRDMYARIVYGARVSLSIAFASTALSALIGMLVGSLTGYVGGKIDKVLSTVMDALYSFPGFLSALVIVVMLGGTPTNLILAVSVPWIAVFFRTARSVAKGISTEAFIEVEKGFGASNAHVIFTHIMPRTLADIIVLASLSSSRAILLVAGLGFLGFGIPPPTPEWGTLINLARPDILTANWWTTFFPGFMITYTALALNIFGEGLNSALAKRYV